MNKPEITPHTNLNELLDAYPELEDKFIELAPLFIKLKNPALRKTIAKVTNLKQASTIANVPLADLINGLRKQAGMNEIKVNKENSNMPKPNWVTENKIKINYDATMDIQSGKHPADKVSREIMTLAENESYVLTTPFVPAPLINIIEEKGFETFSDQESANLFHTYIRKK
jgi:hypothetical protein